MKSKKRNKTEKSDRTFFKVKSLKYILFVLALSLSLNANIGEAQEFYLAPGAEVTLTDGSILTVNGNLTIEDNATLTQIGTGTINLLGDWTINDNGQFIPGNSIVYFLGSSNSIIGGTGVLDFDFFDIDVDKTNTGNFVYLAHAATIARDLFIRRGHFTFDNTAALTLDVDRNIEVVNGLSSFDVDNSGAVAHTLEVQGNIINNGTFDLNMSPNSVANTIFDGVLNSTVSGDPVDFNLITVNKASKLRTVEISASGFTAPQGFLTLTQGTFHLLGTYPFINTFFPVTANNYDINANSGLWIENPNVIVTGQDADLTLSGTLRFDCEYNVGAGASFGNIIYNDNAELFMDDGELNVAGRLSRNLDTDKLNYYQTDGDVKVGMAFNSSTVGRGMFDIGETSSTFTMSDGSIELQRDVAAGVGVADYLVLATNGTVAGGTLRVNDQNVVGQEYEINTTQPVGEFVMIAKDNVRIRLTGAPTTDFSVLGSITLAGNAGTYFDIVDLASQPHNINLGGDWINNFGPLSGGFMAGTGTVTFDGAATQEIQGSRETVFYNLSIAQTVPDDYVMMRRNTVVGGALRLLSNTVLDMYGYDLTMRENSEVYSDAAIAQSFNASKFILNSGGSSGTSWGELRRYTPDDAGLAASRYLLFPLGTNQTTNVYTPSRVEFTNGTALSSAYIGITVVPEEHPDVESPNRSLLKYWSVDESGVTPGAAGINLEFFYDVSEEVGSIGNYHVLQHQGANWFVDPGNNLTNVNIGLRRIYAVQVMTSIDEDWTAGELDAARAIYYSRNDGDYDLPTTWSKDSHFGTVSDKAPHLSADEVYIGNYNTVTLAGNPPAAHIIEVENTGTLFTGTDYIPSTVDTFRVAEGGTLGIGHGGGIRASANDGNVRSASRVFSDDATYIYTGSSSTQNTGDGLPTRVRSLIIDKNALGNRVALTNSVVIGDSLVIREGTITVEADESVNGEAPGGKVFNMWGGEIELEGSYPTGYAPSWFYFGEIDFYGGDALIIPSGGSTPGVMQYNNLTIRGNRGYTAVNFSPVDTIRLYGDFDISALTFINFPTPRFATSGSTIMFNGSGNQDIPRRCAMNADWARLNYYNLIVDGTGVKELDDAIDYLILNDVVINGAADLTLHPSHSYDLTVQGNWINNGGDFTHQNALVTFENLTGSSVNVIDSKNKPFFDVEVDGTGSYYYAGDMWIENDLTINSGGTFGGFDETSSTISEVCTIRGDWNDNGSFVAGKSTVKFAGATTQTIRKTTTEFFHNLTIANTYADNNGLDVVVQNVNGRNITVDSILKFESGVLDVHNGDRFVKVNGNCERPGIGHVYGPLLMHIPADSSFDPRFFAVGDRDIYYRGAEMTFHGIGGGTNDYLQLNQRTQDNGGLHNAAFVDWNHSVAVVWEVTIPDGHTFDMGWRNYDMKLMYTSNDLRSNPPVPPTDPLIFVHRRESGGIWYNPPTDGQTDTSSVSHENDSIGVFILGEPIVRVFYSVADGNWTTPGTWSLISYGGTPSAIHTPTSEDSVRVGDGITVTLDTDFTVDAGLAVVVETSDESLYLGGRLDTDGHIIDGNGDFVLKDGGALGVSHDNGIVAAGTDGNIQTSGIDFNYGGHNNGSFIYNGSNNQVTGSGLPANVATFTVDNPGNTVDLQSNLTCSDSLHIANGTLDVSISNTNITVGGSWRNADTFNEGTRTVTFNGTGPQMLYNATDETFHHLTINKPGDALVLADGDITINGTLNFSATNAGNIDSRTNDQSVIVAGTVIRVNGHVDGEMQKNIPTGNASEIIWEIGSGTDYTPARIDVGPESVDPGTAGYVGIIAMPVEHPEAALSTFNLDKNVHRYWTTTPYGSFDLGDRPFELKLYYRYPDDIRNGADYNDFVIRRYATSTTWTDLTLTDEPAGAYYAYASNIRVMGEDFALGEESPQGTTYYSIASGAWNNPNNWSPDDWNGAPNGTYPNQVNINDIAYIGDGKTITLDQNRTMGSVTVCDSITTTGTLVTGNFYIDGEQFKLLSGGKLSVGSADGITTAGPTGSIRTTIREYNSNNHNNGHFVYTGDAVVTGDGLPGTIASLEININPANTIPLASPIIINDYLLINNGTFSSANNNITLGGNWTNNATYLSGTETVTFNGVVAQLIDGSSETTFNNLTLAKPSDNILLGRNVSIDGLLNFALNGLIVLNNFNVTFGPSATIAPIGSLSSARMIQSDGTTSSGKIIKEHSDGVGQVREFTYPLGIGPDFNKCVLSLQANYTSAKTEVQLLTGPHPNRPPGQDNMLKKYWRINTIGVTNVVDVEPNTRYEFYFNPTDVVGNRLAYVPGRYTSADGWEINVGNNFNIDLQRMQVNRVSFTDGDWTMAEPTSFFLGRIYYSINSGNWDTPSNWSNESHFGAPAILMPGTFPYDTVYIDQDDIIDFNVEDSAIAIGHLEIGTTTNGDLRFVRNGDDKCLRVKGDLVVGFDGYIGETGSGNRIDTLEVWGDVSNSAGGGDRIDFYFNTGRMTKFILAGTGNSTITGAGDWDFWTVEVAKEGGLSDKVINNSTGFTSDLNTGILANQAHFELTKGIYRHELNQTLNLDYSNVTNDGRDYGNDPVDDADDFFMGANSGMEIPTGTLIFGDDLITNNYSLIDISGGNLEIGTGDNENFLYETATTLRISAGTMLVSACFSNHTESAALNLDISGGVITVMDEYSNQYGDIYGFGLKASSTITWSGGRVIYANPTNGGWDYKVEASNYNITGGTLQFGIEGSAYFLNSGQSHSMGTLTPVWNLEVTESRYAQSPNRHCALVLLEAENYVLNDVLIDRYGTLDLNGKNIHIGGNYSNNGRFTPDGRGWDSDGTRKVFLDGALDQQVYSDNPFVNSQSGNSMNNEPFYDLHISKPTGNVVLGIDNSDVFVRNKLIFDNNNTAVIDGRTNDKRVEIWTRTGSDNGEVERLGLGHVDGKLRMEISNAGDQDVLFHVGAGADYVPANLELGTGSGTAGKVQVITYGNDPANIAQNQLNIDLGRNIQRYWTFTEHDGFDLGSREFDLTLTFLDPADKRGGNVEWSVLNQFYMTDPDDPTPPPYTILDAGVKTITTNQSIDNSLRTSGILEGSYIVAELTSLKFYSIATSDWNNGNAWSNVGYGGPPSGTWPVANFHEAYISDDKEITLPNGFLPDIKAVVVEQHNNTFGSLYIEENTYITAQSFTLEDSCTLTIEGADGIVSLADANPNTGAVQASIVRSFGNSHYIFKGLNIQDIGSGLPGEIRSLTIDNTEGGDFNLTFYSQDRDLTINDFLWIKNGKYDVGSGTRNVFIKGDLIMDNDTLRVNNKTFDFNGEGIQQIVLNNPDGVAFNRMFLSKPDLSHQYVEVVGTETDAPVEVYNILRFSDGNTGYLKSAPDHKVILPLTTSNVERLGAFAYGHVDGIMQKQVENFAGESVLYEIGNSATYTPVTMTFPQGGGTTGVIDAINLYPVPLEPFYGNRMDPTVQVPRYWRITKPAGSSFDMGTRKVDLTFEFPRTEFERLTITPPDDPKNAVIRRKSIPAEPYLWTERKFDELDWSPIVVDTAKVSLSPALADDELWPGFGEFFIGEKAQRIFYSRNGGGNWDDSLSWSYDVSGTPIANDYPNPDWDNPDGYRFEIRDSVIIDDNDIIVLNTEPELASIDIQGDLGAGTGGTLIINSSRFIRASSKEYTDSYFRIGENGTLNTTSPLGINADTTNSLLRFDLDKREYNAQANYVYSGGVNQYFGDAFPDSLRDLTIDNPAIVEMSTLSHYLVVNNDINIINGRLAPKNDMTDVYLTGDFTIDGDFTGATATDGTNPYALNFTFIGDNSSAQLIDGSGSVKLFNILLDRTGAIGGAGAGILRLNMSVPVVDLINLRKDPLNNFAQIIELGPGADLTLQNDDPITSLVNHNGTAVPAYRYIRTGTTSGSLIRTIRALGGVYTYPVGSYDSFGAGPAEDHYTPAIFDGDTDGYAAGTIAVRVTQGAGAGAIDKAHERLNSSLVTDYLARYWAIDDVTTTVPGKWRFEFLDGDKITDPLNINTIAKWQPVNEGPPGYWTPYLPPVGDHDMATNYFELTSSRPATEFTGDWTMANEEAFIRIFYSRQNGLWNDSTSWTFDPSHSGPVAGDGLYPNAQLDSAVIGGGDYSTSAPDHEIILNITPVEIRGVAVGTSDNNNGTLQCRTNIIASKYFSLYNYSTLGVGSPDGITTQATGDFGNIQTTENRIYGLNGFSSFIYNNTADNQVVGNALPNTVRNFTCDNGGLDGFNSVYLDHDLSVLADLSVLDGRMDIADHIITGNGGDFNIVTDAIFAIGGSNNMRIAGSGFGDYTGIEDFGIIEFFGADQYIDQLPLPAALFHPVNFGYGSVHCTGAGTKYVQNTSSALKVRGFFENSAGSTFRNEFNANQYPLIIDYFVRNSALINNDGVIEVGQ